MWDWLATPLSGSTSHHVAPWAVWHARSMVLAWCVLLPLGALVARFFKVMPRQDWPRQLDNQLWWHAHRGLQWLGVGVMVAGLCLAWSQGGRSSVWAGLHVWGGWAVCALGAAQVLGGLARGSKGGPVDALTRTPNPGDHYDMTRWRLVFERTHKSLGWVAVLLAVGVTAAGLVVADAPRWMAGVLSMWWLALGVAFWRLQVAGRCIDTYQAIWGPDRSHPGNRMAPVGWGVRRPHG